MTTLHHRFEAIRDAAIAALGTPTDDGEPSPTSRRIAWGNGAVVLLAAPHWVYFVVPRTSRAWWIVDEVKPYANVPLADALRDLRPMVTR